MSNEVTVAAQPPDTIPAAPAAITNPAPISAPALKTYGPNIHSAFIFYDFADYYRYEVGVDPFESDVQRRESGKAIEQLFKKFRRDGTFTDDFLNEVWQEHQQAMGILPPDEQQQKDEFSLAKARAASICIVFGRVEPFRFALSPF